MNRMSQLPPGKPLRLMTQSEKIADFNQRIDDVMEDEAATPYGKAYLALMRRLLQRIESD